MADAALVLACAGCCCGHPAHGGEMAPARVLKAVARRAFKASGLEGRVRLAFTECLGPCSEANVVFLYLHGRPLWLRRMNAEEIFGSLFRHVAETIEDDGRPLPPPLAARSFAWAGGGVGPEPPVERAAAVDA